MTGYLSRDELLALDDLPTIDLPIPEWGGRAVRLRALTKGEQLDIRREATVGGEIDAELVELLAIVAALEEPKLSKEDVGILRARNAAAINRIARHVAVLAGLAGDEEVAEAKRRFPE
jgi:hypothetical protein